MSVTIHYSEFSRSDISQPFEGLAVDPDNHSIVNSQNERIIDDWYTYNPFCKDIFLFICK